MATKTGPISKRHRDLMERPSIKSQLPVMVGKVRLTEWQGECLGCGRPIEDHLLTGRILNPTDAVTTVEAVGICHPCRLLTPFLMRFRHTGYAEWIQDGQWVRVPFGKPTWWEVIKSKLQTLFCLTDKEKENTVGPR